MVKVFVKWVLLCALSLMTASSALAAPLTEQDTLAAQQVVRAQLAAFAADDAEQAFSYATDAIRAQFGTAAQFVRMVRGAYPVVYRPRGVIFLKPEADDDELVQPVHMTDPSGTTWLAVYQLLRQEDKGWRIGGCVLMPYAGKTA